MRPVANRSSARGVADVQVTLLRPGQPAYLAERLKTVGLDTRPLSARGNVDLLHQHQLTALFCSMRCPGELILKTYDQARVLRDANITVISGFHSPMEKECLRLLLRGSQPVVVCLARGIEHMRIPQEWRTPLAEGRLLLLSPFSGSQRRPTAELAALRNDFVAALAHRVIITHAAPGSKTEAFARKVLEWGKPLLTLESDRNANLVALGVRTLGPDDFVTNHLDPNTP